MGEQSNEPQAQSATRLVQQPRPGRQRQLRRRRDQRALNVAASTPEGVGQRREGRSRQLKTVKQFRAVPESRFIDIDIDIVIVIKLQSARRMQSRQFGSPRAPITVIPRGPDVLRPKVDVARVSQVSQKATAKLARIAAT